MRVFVAGSSEQLDRVEDAMLALERAGHTVTWDWVSEVRKVGSANPPYASSADCLKWARDDLRGVDHADVLWVLMPSTGGFGAGVELGYAIAKSVPIVMSGMCNRTIYSAFGTCFDHDDQAIDHYFMEAL